MRKETKESSQSDTVRLFMVTICPESHPIGDSHSMCIIDIFWGILPSKNPKFGTHCLTFFQNGSFNIAFGITSGKISHLN
jgi:hypothetical protein